MADLDYKRQALAAEIVGAINTLNRLLAQAPSCNLRCLVRAKRDPETTTTTVSCAIMAVIDRTP